MSSLVVYPLPDDIFNRDRLAETLKRTPAILPLLRLTINDINEWLHEEFRTGVDVEQLISWRTQFVDHLLCLLWKHFQLPDSYCLIAVGGYGRGELLPHSDIDLLILCPQTAEGEIQEKLSQFITLLWDLKLDIGHSVRTIDECYSAAAADITVATNLMESRPLIGNSELHSKMMQATGSDILWPSAAFFKAKRDEQIQRHSRFADSEHNLEPNIKNSPGGLRDIQMIGWFTQRHFGTRELETLRQQGFLLEEEKQLLLDGRAFLWRLRYALHMITDREEDRLLFDHQRTLATLFGYEDDDARLAVEQLMQRYYQWAMVLAELNEVLIQHFDEAILRACEPENIIDLNSYFRVRNGDIEVTSDKVFERNPSALLEIFVWMAHHEFIDGVRAWTIRLIRDNRHRIDEEFRRDPKNIQLFMQLLRSPHKMSLQLGRMKRYGILGNYLPEFGRIVGQMQHDLFHIYTVDAHTLEVVRHMRRFFYPEEASRFPVVARVVKTLPKPELLYIAGLYHDIAKGRGGDHSTLGAVDARAFCERHGLGKRDTNLVVWLVEKHLYMSTVSQRKDISDPDVINQFALTVGDHLHLDYLYCLTVADINATNPKLWNNWRDSLLRQLYAGTKRALLRGLENPIDRQDWIDDNQQLALEKLTALGINRDVITQLWQGTGEDYFLRESIDDIVWHTEAISQLRQDAQKKEQPLVLIRPFHDDDLEVATQIFVYTKNRNFVFAALTAAMEQLDLSIQDARIYTSSDDYILDTFYVLNADGKPIGDDRQRMAHIRQFLEKQLGNPDQFPELVNKRTPRTFRLFAIPTDAQISVDHNKGCSVLEVITPDRPGLLARIGKIFFNFEIHLQNAKISTLGERVEDVFFITDRNDRPIEDPQLQQDILAAIRRELDDAATTQSS